MNGPAPIGAFIVHGSQVVVGHSALKDDGWVILASRASSRKRLAVVAVGAAQLEGSSADDVNNLA